MTTAINNGKVIDVHLKKIQNISIKVENGKITELSPVPLEADRIIDASGLYVAPGFIDVHGHVDGDLYAGELSACQGVTTTIGGNCGYCPVNMKSFFREQEEKGFPINQAMLVGHGVPIREAVGLTDPYKAADGEQVKKMVALAEQALEDGACGVSFGLDYVPGSGMEEIIALARVSAKYGRVCPVHTRLLTDGDLYSLYELFYVAEKTGARILISHFVYQYCNGLVEDAIAMVEKARSRGLDIQIDSGMYTNWTTYFDTTTFDYQNIVNNGWKWEQMVVATGKYRGQIMTAELFHHMKKHCPHEAIVFFEGEEHEVHQCLRLPYAMPSSDIGAYAKGEGHPQIAGTFPKYLKEMVREHKFITLEEAIYKTTLFPAQVFGLENKGMIETGYDADITIFDLDSICDKAQYPHLGAPDAKPEGIPYVMVNGEFVVDRGVYTGSKSGKIVKK